ncbi:hypothetical protein TNCV_4078071, partial [Trichonephila clavipes]
MNKSVINLEGDDNRDPRDGIWLLPPRRKTCRATRSPPAYPLQTLAKDPSSPQVVFCVQRIPFEC